MIWNKLHEYKTLLITWPFKCYFIAYFNVKLCCCHKRRHGVSWFRLMLSYICSSFMAVRWKLVLCFPILFKTKIVGILLLTSYNTSFCRASDNHFSVLLYSQIWNQKNSFNKFLAFYSGQVTDPVKSSYSTQLPVIRKKHNR